MSDVYLWDTYEKVGREALERKDFTQAIESFRAAVAVAEKLQGEDLRLVMSLRHLSAATAKAGQLSLAHDLLGRTEEIAVTRLGGTHSETVQVKRDLYELSRQLGHLDQAESYLVEVLGVVRAHGETEEFLEILELLAQLAGERERLDNAAVLYKEIVEARAALYGEDHPSVAQALLWLSTALSRSGQGEAAEAPLARAFAMLEQQFAEDPKSLAQSLLAGAELMTSSGRPAAALEHQKRALNLLTSVLDEGHQSLWDTREMIASTLASLGRLEESIELLEYCLQNRQARDHRTGAMLKNLAGLYLSLQKVERAEGLYKQASELLHKTLGPEHPASLAAIEERIQLYHFTGRPQEALDLALTTIRPTEQRFGAGHPNTAQVYASTAVLAHAARKWETAYELMKAAEAIWESLTPRPLDVLSNCRLNMATCLIEMGRKAEAALALNKVTVSPGSPLENVVRDLWARLESTPPAAPPTETPASQRRSIKLSPEPLPAPAPEPEAPIGSGPRIWDASPPPPLAAAQSGTERNWGARPHAEPAEEPAQQGVEANPFDDLPFTELNHEEISELKAVSGAAASVEETPDLPTPSAPAATPLAASEEAGDLFSGDDGLFSDERDPFVDSWAAQAESHPSPESPSVENTRAETAGPANEAASLESAVQGPASGDQATLPADPLWTGARLPVEEPERSEPAAAWQASPPPDSGQEYREPSDENHGAAGDGTAPESLESESVNADLFEDVVAQEHLSVGLESGSSDAAEPMALAGPPAQAQSPLWDEPRDLSWDEGEPYARPAQEPLDEPSAELENGALVSEGSAGSVPESRHEEPSQTEASPEETPSEQGLSEDTPDPDDDYDPEDGDERRRSRRFNLGLNRFFDLALRNEKGELQVIRSFLVDLSGGGLRVNTERPLPLRETFELTLPAELLKEEMRIPARVTWQRALFGASYIQGLEFQKIGQQQRAHIEAILDESDLQEKGRQHYRLYRPFPIQVSHQEYPDWVSSYASDLSLEGVGTRLESEIRTGQAVRLRLGLEFELPTVEVEATVAWSRYGSNGVSHGLRFDEVGPVEARTIRLYIDRCLELSPD